MASRVTQQVVEVLATTTPQARVTQQLAEVLTHENPATGIRVEQHVVEVLLTTTPPVSVTQHVLEGLWTESPFLGALVTQHLLEVLWMDAPVPLPPLVFSDATVQMHASLRAELLLADARFPLERALALGAEWGEIVEVVLPDGTVTRPVLPARAGYLVALLVTSDKAVQVRVGAVAQNQALALRPGGVYALLGSDAALASPCTLSYTPGDGSVATCAVLALTRASTLAGCARLLADAELSQQFTHCWDLDEDSGARVDHVGGLTLVEYGGVVPAVSGKTGQAALFPGYPTNVVLRVIGGYSLLAPPYTVAFWTRLAAYPSLEHATFLGNGTSQNAGQYDTFVGMNVFTHQVFLQSWSSGMVTHPTVISLGTWHLIVAWQTATELTIQIDNAVIATAPAATYVPGSFSFHVGGLAQTYGLPGAIDTVMVWARALTTQAERDLIWNGGRG